METFQVQPIGNVRLREDGMFIEVAPAYIPALEALNGFSHINVLWWCSDFDTREARGTLQTPQPYKGAPDIMGIFATRSPIRPNPIALTAVQVIRIDASQGLIQIPYIDAHDGTPVLDIKPYTPSFDRVEAPGMPEWCRHWPMSLEQSACFDWEGEFLF